MKAVVAGGSSRPGRGGQWLGVTQMLQTTTDQVLQAKKSVPARRPQFEFPAARPLTGRCGRVDASLRAQWPVCFAFFVVGGSGGKTGNLKIAPKRC